jgi:hypothetical protein
MPIEIADRVSALILEAGRIERESETVYLELGRIFPRLSEEMSRGADNGDSSLGALSALQRDRQGLSGKGDSGFVDKAAHYFAALRERDSAFLAKINEGITRLGALDEIISRVRADSEEMEIISLNAMTVALKSGGEGKAFSVITDELKRLSGRTISLSEGVTASGRSLLDFFAKLRNVLAELDGFQRDFFSTIDQTLGSGYEELERGLSGANSFFSTLLGEARLIREPVLRVMGEIQLQDIVRQSLQHVGLSLDEARSSALVGDIPTTAFIAAVAELCENLVGDIAVKLESSASTFGSDMDTVSDIVSESERKRLGFLEEARASKVSVDPGAFQRGSERYLELKRSVVSMSSRLADYVRGLDKSFKGLAAILARFQNIVVASRIEVAKTKALAGVSNTVAGMIVLTDRIEADVGEAMETTKGFNLLADEAIKSYAQGSGAAEGDRLGATLAEVEENMTRLSRASEAVRSAIDAFSLYTDDFIDLISRAGAELAKLRGLTDRLQAVGLELGRLKTSIREGLGPDAAAVEPQRMRNMVERFTIFTHKKAAGDIGRFAVEEGGKSGEVTIF